jgi:hypothetical protein
MTLAKGVSVTLSTGGEDRALPLVASGGACRPYRLLPVSFRGHLAARAVWVGLLIALRRVANA